MINYVRGTIIRVVKNTITVLAGAIGYEIHVSPVTALSLKEQQEVALFTHFQVREDAQELYGFLDTMTLDFFRLLLSVSGIGPKSALNCMALGSVEEIKQAIGRGDVTYLTRVSGIGKKTAERIVVELKEKVGGAAEGAASSGALADVVEALMAMGYSRDEARAGVQGLNATDASEKLLKQALKNLAR